MLLRKSFLLVCVAAFVATASMGCVMSYRSLESLPNKKVYRDIIAARWKKQLVRREIFDGTSNFLERALWPLASFVGYSDYKHQEWASPAIDHQETVYVGSTAGELLAVDIFGKIKWRIETKAAVASQPLIDEKNQRVYFGNDDGIMFAVDQKTGKKIWTFATQGTINEPPVLADGLLLFTSNENRIYAIEAATGKWRWQYDREIPEGFLVNGYAGVAVAKDKAYTGFADGVVVALKPRTGEILWTQTLVGDQESLLDVDSTPVIAGDLLCVSSHRGGIFALDPDIGGIRWRYAAEGSSAAAVYRGQLIFASPEEGIFALDYQGGLIWRQHLPQGAPSRPVVWRNYILVNNSARGLQILNAQTGQLLQFFPTGYGADAYPAISSNSVAFITNEGTLYDLAIR